jgi:glutaredoxin
MDRASLPWVILAGVIALALTANASAQGKQVYRYVDANGKVVYSDQPPPPGAKNIQPKRMDGNVIETNDLPLAAQQASERFPVTLYTFDCGELCQGAEALLNRRGIPYTTVNVSEQQGAAKLMALTGSNLAPALQVGDKLVSKGLNEPRWQAMLDDAGYPRTPSPRRLPPGKGTEAPPTPAPAKAPAAPQAAAPADGGYPK